MRHPRYRASSGLLVSAALALMFPAVASADTHAKTGANVNRGTGCFMLLPSGEETFPDEQASRLQITSASGRSLIVCKGRLPAGVTPPRQALVLRGFDCFGEAGRQVISPNGRVILTCHFFQDPVT
jgi:hypothetical protein